MLLVPANNMTTVAGPGQVAMVTTDPYPLNGDDRLDAMINVHTIFNTTAPGLSFALEVSNDGQTFTPFGANGDRNSTGAQQWTNKDVAWAYFRVVLSLAADAAVVAGVTFDCHMNIDKQGA